MKCFVSRYALPSIANRVRAVPARWTLSSGKDVPVQAHIVAPAAAADVSGRVGGVPGFATPGGWPKCSRCGCAMVFWAEFLHAPPAVDLGQCDRAIQVFGCRYECLPRRLEDRGTGLVTRVADVGVRRADDSVPGTRVLPEFWILGWWEADDTIPSGATIEDLTFREHLREVYDRMRDSSPGLHLWTVFCDMNVEVGGAMSVPLPLAQEIRAGNWTPWMQIGRTVYGVVPEMVTADDLGTWMHIEGSRVRRRKWGPFHWSTTLPVNSFPRGFVRSPPGVPAYVVVSYEPAGFTSWFAGWEPSDFPEDSEEAVLGFRRGAGNDAEYAFILCRRPSH